MTRATVVLDPATAAVTPISGDPVNQILIAQREERSSSLITKSLRTAGYTPTAVRTGREAFDHARTGEFDLLVMDPGLPDVDGLAVLRGLRAKRVTLPVILLTTPSAVADTVTGLGGAVDDVIAKPFRLEELMDRIRSKLPDHVDPGEGDDTVLTYGRLALDLRLRQTRVAGREIHLSAREFALAEAFLRHPGHVLSREQLRSQVWGYDFDPRSNVVDVYVRYLRNKIGPDHVATVRSKGYRLVDPAEA